MSYTSPSNTATNFSFAGKVPYTQTNPQVTNFNFGFTTAVATGFVSGTFGTPLSKPNAKATGIAPTAIFGTARNVPRAATLGLTTMFGFPVKKGKSEVLGPWAVTTMLGTPTAKVKPVTTSINSTTFGVPSVYPFYARELLVEATFGTPTGFVGQRVTGYTPNVQWGIPLARVNQTTKASGFQPTRFGTPWYYLTTTIPLNVTGWATGLSTTLFGTPSLKRTQIGIATGIHSTLLGTPSALRGGRATGFLPVTFGQPNGNLKTTGVGFSTTLLGTAIVKVTGKQTGRSTTAFGTASVSRSNTYLAWSIEGARFGTPLSSRIPLRSTTGFTSTNFGAADAKAAYRAKSFRSTQVGYPIMRRPC